ncbi:MAG: uncharacterized protein KVP18_001006 [Porospora cf. gigantea A]|nr:MAG: hypothetical protein KVP18_001006 [Porospora cf. gigantea A]
MRLNLGGNSEARRAFASQADKVDFESPLVTKYNASLAASASAALGCSSPQVIDESPVASFITPVTPATPVSPISASFNGSSPKPSARRVNTIMKGSKLDDFDFDLNNFTFVPPKPQPTVQPTKQPTKPVDDLKVYDISAGQQRNPQSTVQLDSRFKAAKAISSADIYASSTPPDLTFRADLASANAISSDMYFGRHQPTTDLDVQVQNVTEQGRQLVEAAAVEARLLANRAFDWFQQNFI